MNVHYFLGFSFPHGMAGTKRVLCYAKGLNAQGHTAFVHVCHRFHSRNSGDGLPATGTYQGIAYDHPAGKFKAASKLKRGFDYYFLDSLKVFAYALKNIKRTDMVYVYLYPIFTQVLLQIAAKTKGAKIVKETCEHPSALGKVNSRWHKLCKWFEFHFVMPHYDGFIAISRNLREFVLKYKGRKAQCIIIPILVEFPAKNDNTTNADKSEYSVPYIIHTGTMLEQKDSISKILRAFSRFKCETDSNCRIVFTGPHATEKCKYIPLIKELGIENSVDLLGMVSTERVASLQRHAAMTIIYKSDNLQTRNCFPTKLGEMLISGVPVITTTVGDANLYLENGKNAFIIEPDDEDTLVRDIELLLDDPTLARKIGNAGKDVALKNFNPSYQGKRLSEFFRQL